MLKLLLCAHLLLTVCVAPSLAAREWSDATGTYKVEGDLIGLDGTTIVIQTTDKKKQLVALRISQLSKTDQEYLKSAEAAAAARKAAAGEQTWTMKSGLKVNARAVDYGRRDVTIQRRRSKVYVNDRLFDNLSGVQQTIVLRIVSHFENTPIESRKEIEQWILKLKGAAKTYTCDGVMLELPSGDEYGVPFFLFSDDDLKVLEPGWKQWLAAYEAREKTEQAQADQEREALLLQKQAEAYQRDHETERQLKQVELDLLAAAAGVTSIWEVDLRPRGGGYSRTVMVPGRDSDVATRAALDKFPNCTVIGIARRSR
ncbi:MAG: SHD1 domain-containing protein [Pirellulales bacterium]